MNNIRTVEYKYAKDINVVPLNTKGGDTDTNAAVAGALLGARYGYDAIPKRWLRVLHGRDRLTKAVEWFVRPG